MPNFSIRSVRPRDADDVVLVVPEGDAARRSSTKTKEIVRKSLNPKAEGLQVKGVRGIRDGGVPVVLAEKGQGERQRRSEDLRQAGLHVSKPRRQRPKVMYDVPRSMGCNETADFVFEQGGAPGCSKEEFLEGFKVLSRVNFDDDLCNVV